MTLNDVAGGSGDGFATVNVTTATGASTLQKLAAGGDFATLAVTGDQALTITDALANTVTTINAAGNSGAVKLTSSSVTLTATGGTGTADQLTLSAIPGTATISGFETVVAGAAGTVNLTNITGATTLGVAANAGAVLFTNAAATTNTINLSGNYQGGASLSGTAPLATGGAITYTPVSLAAVATDTLTVAVDNGGSANTGTYTVGTAGTPAALTAANVETLTLTTADWSAVTLGGISQSVAPTVAGSVTVSGASNLTLGAVNITGNTSTNVDTYNFGGVTGTLNATIGATGNASVTGAAGIDTLTTTAIAGTAAVKTQTFNLGNGDDSITFVSDTTALGAANLADKLVLNGEAGNDAFRYTTAAAANTDLVTIAGGVGTDTLFVSGAGAFGPTATVSGVEAITFNQTANSATTLAWTGGATDIVTVTALGSATETLALSTPTGTGALNTSNWVWQGWTAGADLLDITGGDSADNLFGGTTQINSANTLEGGAGNDTITGGTAADLIIGGSGDDTLTVGGGADQVIGGTGSDTIALGATGDADLVYFHGGSGTAGSIARVGGLGVDTITGFTGGVDKLYFSAGDFGALGTGGAVGAVIADQIGYYANTTTALNTANAVIDGNGTFANTSGGFAVVGSALTSGTTVDLYFIKSGATVANTLAAEVTAGNAVKISTITLNGTLVATDFVSVNDLLIGTAGADTLTGTAAAETILGRSGVDVITGGAGADAMTGGAGADVFIQADGASVVKSASNLVGANFAAADTITFANGVDVITGFTAGTGGDSLDVGTAGAAITGIGVAAATMTATKTLFLSGAYVVATGVFTIAADGTGADTLIVDTTVAADQAIATADTWVVLVGVDSDNLVAANFI